jgi:5-methylthioadenosine/S-adenosylhomocysteine deaminase
VPLYNVYSQLVYALKGSDVEHVMVNGRLIVRSRRMLTLNAPQILAAAEKYKQKIQAGGLSR